ncbi:uncharacterized protein LOC141848942 [Brevipalpus obovatus]|uniref:uncharacterized protein LOC141848942 n=1 Tax=Brevipalpus obovatus TaxID=246614 RepID=UPI003D9EF111
MNATQILLNQTSSHQMVSTVISSTLSPHITHLEGLASKYIGNQTSSNSNSDLMSNLSKSNFTSTPDLVNSIKKNVSALTSTLASTSFSTESSVKVTPQSKDILTHGVNKTANFINETLGMSLSHTSHEEESSNVSVFLIALLSLVISTGLVLGILMLIRKNRLDRLRHHLMPVYNFDPNEDGDWETELLDEPFGSQQTTMYTSDADGGAMKPSLKLDSGLTGGLNVKPGSVANNNNNRATPSSGLLNNNNGHTNRVMYTNERPIV